MSAVAEAVATPVKVLQITPHLVVRGGNEAIEFYKKAFGATELMRMPSPDGQKLWHAAIQIGGLNVMLADEFPEMGSNSPQALNGSPVTIHLQVNDADAVYAQAVEAGATAAMPLSDMFWGDRYGQVIDPFGHHWSIAHKIADLTPEQMRAAGEKFAAENPGGCS